MSEAIQVIHASCLVQGPAHRSAHKKVSQVLTLFPRQAGLTSTEPAPHPTQPPKMTVKCTLIKHFPSVRCLTGPRAVLVLPYATPWDYPPDKSQVNPILQMRTLRLTQLINLSKVTWLAHGEAETQSQVRPILKPSL